ncbi:MAG: hypothetical protein Q4D85_12105 [Corynebacterium sp.]|uniref:hypothetical protein n=1 Tax=Corynebacterium sp. TaxID=1720 RepID=UPI0026DBCBF0|nr:hypothetical protein [Corynebacterium sp.]MDO5099479.1 hypothetical protein [Corynebacterium sp.]
MEQLFSDMSVQMAYERAGADKTTYPETALHVARDIESVLQPGEFVLELADTTSPGFHSLVGVTNRRILLGTGPGQLQEINVDMITGWDLVEAPDLTLVLKVFDAEISIFGLGVRGVKRLHHALSWLALYQLEPPESWRPERTVSDIFEDWLAVHRELPEDPTAEEMHDRLSGILVNKKWW